MLKSYEAIYENGKLNWLSAQPPFEKARVIVVVEEDNNIDSSIKKLKGIVPKPNKAISLEEMDNAIQMEGAKL